MDIIKVGRKEIDEMKEEIGKKKMEIDETKKEIKDIKSKIAKVRTKIKEVESIFRIVEDAKSLKEHPLALCGCLSRMTSRKQRDERIEKELVRLGADLADLKAELTEQKHRRDTLEQRCITLEAQQNELQRHRVVLLPFFGSGSDEERILGSNTHNGGSTNPVKLLAAELQSYIFASTTGMTYNPTTPRDYCHKEVQLSFAFQ